MHNTTRNIDPGMLITGSRGFSFSRGVHVRLFPRTSRILSRRSLRLGRLTADRKRHGSMDAMESIIGCEGSWPGLAVGQKKSSAEVVSITLEEFVDCLLAATAEDVNPKVSTPASDWPAN